MKKKALLSVYDKKGIEVVARRLIALGYQIISSGGTALYLTRFDVLVTDVSVITHQTAVLNHRVVTLAPQIHGGLLATKEMSGELDQLGWPKIDFLYVTFYPLEGEMRRDGCTLDSCVNLTDIGGPAMVRSAAKGGEVIVLASNDMEEKVLQWMEHGEQNRDVVMQALRGRAERAAAHYIAASASVYETFVDLNPPELQ